MTSRLRRRGLSPLIATILLIAFAVAIATVILGIDAPADDDACAGVELEFQTLPNGPAICYDAQGRNFIFTVKNKGIDVDYVQLRVFDRTQNSRETDTVAPLASGAASRYELGHETLSPSEMTATLVPGILDDSDGEPIKTLCPAAEVEVVRVPMCE